MQHLIRGAMSLLHFSWIALWLSTVVNTFQVTAIENIFMYVYLNGMHIHMYFFQTIDRGDVIRDVSTNDHRLEVFFKKSPKIILHMFLQR